MRKIVILLAVLALSGAGCAANEPSTISEPSGDPYASPAKTAETSSTNVNDHGTKTFTSTTFTAEVEQDNEGGDFYFEPTFIKAPGASTATVKLHNAGTVPHTFTIPSLNIDETLQADENQTVEVKLGTGTRVEFYCNFHKDSGMRGAFQLH